MFAYDFETGRIKTNVFDDDPAENGFHCCDLPLGHEGRCSCDECGAAFDPDGVLRTIGECQNAEELLFLRLQNVHIVSWHSEAVERQAKSAAEGNLGTC
jgi:hypothetical protein